MTRIAAYLLNSTSELGRRTHVDGSLRWIATARQNHRVRIRIVVIFRLVVDVSMLPPYQRPFHAKTSTRWPSLLVHAVGGQDGRYVPPETHGYTMCP